MLTGVTRLARRLTTARQTPIHARRLRRTQVEALFVLAHSSRPVTPSVLAAKLGVTAGAVSQLLDSLRAQDLIATVENPIDGRSRVVVLTEAARTEIDAFEQSVVADLLPMFGALTTSELGKLAELLNRLPE
ncbi:MAG TPA: MarR family winged helix-turn-helix transcriptional regulator [Pseudonocardiaceae bacterium]|nr:MarR family winged helix-turn-helix transcriptional regulator [Pseudonocardiaceae bacterium]